MKKDKDDIYWQNLLEKHALLNREFKNNTKKITNSFKRIDIKVNMIWELLKINIVTIKRK